MAELVLNKDNFKDEVLSSETPVLVDFWAAWCGPCKALAPIISRISGKYAGRLKVGSVNIDEERDLAFEYGVMSVPTVLLFKDGELLYREVGYHSEAEYESIFQLII